MRPRRSSRKFPRPYRAILVVPCTQAKPQHTLGLSLHCSWSSNTKHYCGWPDASRHLHGGTAFSVKHMQSGNMTPILLPLPVTHASVCADSICAVDAPCELQCSEPCACSHSRPAKRWVDSYMTQFQKFHHALCRSAWRCSVAYLFHQDRVQPNLAQP